ncbi:hypothetical protein N0V90_009866 [Kalmusia sp. IMI 367209]|nr:hypothetical protein N0V90_009866 [Kalmusia sp. IMI 367209]
MADDQHKLEKTYSRESRMQRDGLEPQTTPVALVRSVTQRSRRGSRARIPTIYDLDNDPASDVEKGDEIKEYTTPESCSDAAGDEDGPAEQRRFIRFEDGDPENPNNWSKWKKLYALFVAIMSGATGPISKQFKVTNEAHLILPTSMYLVGYVGGPMIWGPLSESYGRKWVMIASFAYFTIFAIASAVAPNFAALVVFRMMVGIGGSCAISVVGGICADVYHDPVSRGRSMAIFMAATTFGPILGPPISGFISVISWSWAFWIGAIFAGATWPLFVFFPETYGPVILKRRAQRVRKETGDESIVAPIELEKSDIGHIVTVTNIVPTDAIFYIYFQSFPLIFVDIYHFNAGEEGLTFLPIGVGAIISAIFYLAWDFILRRAQAANKPWSRNEEMRRLPLACIAGPFFVISSFWLSWTARADVHWMVPCLASMLFGMGYLCLFHGTAQLPRRRVRDLRCICYGGRVSVAIIVRRRVTVCSEADVQSAGRGVGDQSARYLAQKKREEAEQWEREKGRGGASKESMGQQV